MASVSTPLLGLKEGSDSPSGPCGRARRFLHKWGWAVLGHVLFVVGNILSFVSLGYGPQSLLSAMGSVQFVSNVFLARLVLGERVTIPVLAATGVILTGNVVAVVYGPKGEVQYDAGELERLYTQFPYPVYLGCVAGLFLVSATVVVLLRRRHRRRVQAAPKGEPPPVAPAWEAPITAVGVALACGAIGTQSVTLAKSLSILLKGLAAAALRRGDYEFDPFAFAVVALWLLTMAVWVVGRARAIREYDASFIGPVLQVVWTLLAVVGGGLYFREFMSPSFSAVDAGLFGAGLSVSLAGVIALAYARYLVVLPVLQTLALADRDAAPSPDEPAEYAPIAPGRASVFGARGGNLQRRTRTVSYLWGPNGIPPPQAPFHRGDTPPPEGGGGAGLRVAYVPTESFGVSASGRDALAAAAAAAALGGRGTPAEAAGGDAEVGRATPAGSVWDAFSLGGRPRAGSDAASRGSHADLAQLAMGAGFGMQLDGLIVTDRDAVVLSSRGGLLL